MRKMKYEIRSTKSEIRSTKQYQNSNVQIFKTDSFAVILSEAKNLIIRRPDPSASPQDDTKCHFGHFDLFRISTFDIRILLVHGF